MRKQTRKNKENMEKRRKKAWAKSLKRKNKLNKATSKSQAAKNKLKNAVAEKMNMFSRLPDKCNLCSKGFDRNDRKEVESWKVVITGDKVDLYCPPCQKIVDEKIAEKRAETEGEENGL